MAKLDPEIVAHLEWLGFVQPTGLVVSAPALARAGAILNRHDADGQRLLRECVLERDFPGAQGPAPHLPDFREFATRVLDWNFSPKFFAGTPECPVPCDLELPLPDYGETLRPDYAVREPEVQNDRPPWQLLVSIVKPGQDLDHIVRGNGSLEASAHGRMERLLRHTGVAAGLLFNGRALRLISAPRGESSGWMDFRVADMVQTAGRPISTSLRLLLRQSRLLSGPRAERLSALLEDSRKFQNEVSERLAEQVLHALYELLRGFQAAHDASNGELLRGSLAEHPDKVYHALLTVMLRLVFLLYAEERDMLPEDEIFLRYYSLTGLHKRLREDAALYPDTMDQRFGAWAQLLVLFRLIFDGAECDRMHLPRRHGVLFDPDRFPFLEGRPSVGGRQKHERIEPPLVPDGTVFRILEKLLILDGERISYRALDVEQIGSVYETMMGFRLETASGRSVAIKAQKKHGAPTTVDLEALLAEPGDKREKWLRDRTDRKLADTLEKAVLQADTLEDLHAALRPVTDQNATPDIVPRGAMVLQPSEERRRSGSHYTPRALSEPIVRTTLEPILARLRSQEGRPPRPEQILDLKVCDPAMGSGAFLVEACRQLADALIEAWNFHGGRPEIPPDEDQVVFARRLVTQRCLYGVDKNSVAVDLAKVSLWLVTLARDHALTFVDHALRNGDSLVGLTYDQIEAFHWDPRAPRFQAGFETMQVRTHLTRGAELRHQIRNADETVSDWELRCLCDEMESTLSSIRQFGHLAIAAFFESENPREREGKRSEYAGAIASGEVERYRDVLEEWPTAEQPLVPLHWEIEFPEVFERKNPGFDLVVGNPPFLGGRKISGIFSPCYLNWLHHAYPESSGQVDLVAFFFRRVFQVLRAGGALGLIATKTIAKGDTRNAALVWIRKHGGQIFSATRRLQWPGSAASVIVSIVHILKRGVVTSFSLDGIARDTITAYLFHSGSDDDPVRLQANSNLAFMGYYNYGAGFTFDDSIEGAEPLSTMHELIRKNPANQQRIFPFLGGSEMLTDPRHEHKRYVIDFGSMTEAETRRWPDLFAILEFRVRPERQACRRDRLRDCWWQFGEVRPGLRAATAGKRRILMHPYTLHSALQRERSVNFASGPSPFVAIS